LTRASRALLTRMRALRRDRALRDEEGVFVAEGARLAREAVRAGASVELAIHSGELAATPEGSELLRDLLALGAPVHTCSDDVLGTLQDARSHQPVVLVVRRPRHALGDVLARAAGAPLVVVADGVQDPGNLGSLVRSADAAGATALVTTGAGADLYHPRAVRATAGSIFRLPVMASGVVDLRAALDARGIRKLGTSPRGTVAHDRVPWREPVALFLGSEGGGLSAGVVAMLDGTVRIPMREGVESLSVGAAAAVLLFEAARQRGATTRGPAGG
jgi:TrmH family RNA methyltransferase